MIGILIFITSNAQSPQLNWAKTFNGKSISTDSSSVVKMYILDKSIYIAGTSDAYGKGNDIVLIKRDYATGDTLWTRHYNGSANSDDQAVDMEINQTTGDVYITGKTTGLSTGYDIVTLKYSASGVLGWIQIWDNNYYHGDDIPKDISIDGSGRIIISAYTFNGNSGYPTYYEDLLALVYNSTGSLINSAKRDLASSDRGGSGYINSSDIVLAAKVSNNGEIFAAGELKYPTYSEVFVYGLKSSNMGGYYNSSCVGSDYVRNFPLASITADDTNLFNSIDLDNSNNVYLATLNDTVYGIGTFCRIVIRKINNTGCLAWEKETGGDISYKNLGVKSIKADLNGNVYAAGFEKNITSNFDWFVIKYNSSGVFQWRVTKKGTVNGSDLPYDISFDEFQNPIVVGVTKNTGTNNDITFVKYNKTNGAELFSVNYDSGNGDEKAYNIIVDASQNIIINGIVNTTTQSQNMVILRYCNPPVAAGVITGTTSICQGQNSITYTVPEIDNATSYIWTLPTGATGASTTNSISVNYSSSAISGNISVKGHNDCSDGTSSSLSIEVNQRPATPIVSISGNALHSNSTIGNQWFNNNGLIDGAISQDYTPKTSGDYYVVVSANGCSSNSSNIMHFIPTGINPIESAKSVKAYPNPVTNELTIELEGNSVRANFVILNSLGQAIYNGTIFEKTTIQTTNFTTGVYLIKLESGKTFEFKKVIKQ